MEKRVEKGKELEAKRNGSKMSQYGWAASSQYSKGSNETFIDKTRNIGSNKKLRPTPLNSAQSIQKLHKGKTKHVGNEDIADVPEPDDPTPRGLGETSKSKRTSRLSRLSKSKELSSPIIKEYGYRLIERTMKRPNHKINVQDSGTYLHEQ